MQQVMEPLVRAKKRKATVDLEDIVRGFLPVCLCTASSTWPPVHGWYSLMSKPGCEGGLCAEANFLAPLHCMSQDVQGCV